MNTKGMLKKNRYSLLDIFLVTAFGMLIVLVGRGLYGRYVRSVAKYNVGTFEFSAYDNVLAFLAKQPSLSVVQIGAYIGDTPNDPLYAFLRDQLKANEATSTNVKRDTKVVLVEPIREYFDLLRENYRDLSGVEFENVAIAETEGVKEMYRLKVDPVEHGYPAWLAQLSSFKKERMEELWDQCEKDPDLKKFYLENRVVESVKCVTLQQLMDKHQFRQLDLLQIDAEGYEFEILKTLDFDKTRPRFICYETVLLIDEDKQACRQMLSEQGYLFVDGGTETLCIRID